MVFSSLDNPWSCCGTPIVSTEQMRAVERAAPGGEAALMHQAGMGLADLIEAIAKKRKSRKVILLAGKGNNAGDGYIAGKLLLDRGYEVTALSLFQPEEGSWLQQQAAKRFSDHPKGSILALSSCSLAEHLTGDDLLVDGLFGTGFKGRLSSKWQELFRTIEAIDPYTIAIDVPSGIVGDEGLDDPHLALKADLTAYIHYPKIGLFLGQSWQRCGALHRIPLQTPSQQFSASTPILLSEELCAKALPTYERQINKYARGVLLLAAGSQGMCGAAALSGLAALRTGSGLVLLALHDSAMFHLSAMPLEVVTKPYRSVDLFLDNLHRPPDSMVVGPGLGSLLSKEWVFSIRNRFPNIPLLIDADGLHALAELLQGAASPKLLDEQTILTPHRGELAHLLGTSSIPQMLSKSLINEVTAFTKKQKCFLLVKGSPTLLVDPCGAIAISAAGTPALATAGSGDLLSGIIGSLCSQKRSIPLAMALGCTLHGLAGRIASEKNTIYSTIATDIAAALPSAFQRLTTEKTIPHDN